MADGSAGDADYATIGEAYTQESLPFDDDAFDAAMTTFSVHQWSDLRAGLREMRRVTRGPVVILTCDPDLVRAFWLQEYAPEVLDTEARRYPSTADLADGLGGVVILDDADIETTARTLCPGRHVQPGPRGRPVRLGQPDGAAGGRTAAGPGRGLHRQGHRRRRDPRHRRRPPEGPRARLVHRADGVRQCRQPVGMRTDFGVSFGGFKQSGIGREGVHQGLPHFLETKFMVLEGNPDGYENTVL